MVAVADRQVLTSSPARVGARDPLQVPGDKSVSHRSLMFAAIADGESQIDGLLEGADCLATAAALRAMGVKIHTSGEGRWVVQGVGLHGLSAPSAALDLGNSGTGMRLFSGLLAGQSFASVLVGDESLSRRPMARVTEPLNRMGAHLETVDGHAPISIKPVAALQGINHQLPVASAQIKSALLLAGLYARSPVTVHSPGPCRDHTERMLSAMGVRIDTEGQVACLHPAERLSPVSLTVPADLSSAAFFLVAAALSDGGRLTLPGVGTNPTRSGVLQVLESMGAQIDYANPRECSGEPVADLTVTGTGLSGATVPPELVPLAIDEFPVLFVAAAGADGTSRFSGLAELRHKESDRIASMVAGLRRLGVTLEEGEDWVNIEGGTLNGGVVDSFDDHRVAMAFAVAGTIATGPVVVERPANITTSFPDFVPLACAAGMDVTLSAVE